jgi:regulator of replication initiation timing
MTDEEKTQYKNRLFRESDEISNKIKKQLGEIEQVRIGMRETIKGNRDLQEWYQREEEEFRTRMESKRRNANYYFSGVP